MRNTLIYIFLLLIGVYVNELNAQSTADTTDHQYYKIGGEIQLKEISKKGNLYILLVTEETFKTPLHSYKKLILPIGEKEIKQKTVTFEFNDIRIRQGIGGLDLGRTIREISSNRHGHFQSAETLNFYF